MGGRSVEDSGKPTAESNRETAAIDEIGEPPGPEASLVELRAYWRRRQDALPTNKIVDDLEPHEIEFYEEFIRAGNDVELIPKDKVDFKSTNDFRWLSRNSVEIEVKSVQQASYKPIAREIRQAVSRARENGVVKERFIVAIRGSLSSKLEHQLGEFNMRNPTNRISQLWIWSNGLLQEIPLLHK